MLLNSEGVTEGNGHYIVYLHDQTWRLFFCSDVNETQEDVLQLDEEGVWVHCPVLPCPETRHHPLLWQMRIEG